MEIHDRGVFFFLINKKFIYENVKGGISVSEGEANKQVEVIKKDSPKFSDIFQVRKCKSAKKIGDDPRPLLGANKQGNSLKQLLAAGKSGCTHVVRMSSDGKEKRERRSITRGEQTE